MYLVSSAGVEKCLMISFIKGSTSEPYVLLVQPVLVRAERVNVQHVTNFVYGACTLSGYLAHAQAMCIRPFSLPQKGLGTRLGKTVR